MKRALATAFCLLGLILGLAACESGTTLQGGGGGGGGDSSHGRVKMGFPF